MVFTPPRNTTRPSLCDPRLTEKIQQLRLTNNITNFFYLGRTYLYLALIIGATIGFYHYQSSSGLSFWWNVPITILAIVFIGGGQHHLGTLGHEGTHHLLFKNRYLNELASDWLCMFPILSSTYHYRLEHLAHHQFVNDPDRDSKLLLLKASRHWHRLSQSKGNSLIHLFKLTWIPDLVRYMAIRVSYNSMINDKNVYRYPDAKSLKTEKWVGFSYFLVMIALAFILPRFDNVLFLAIIPTLLWIGVIAFFALQLGKLDRQSRIHPVIPLRTLVISRMTYIMVSLSAVIWISFATKEWVILYYLLLWLVPLLTSFSFFLILRDTLQHENADRGWLTNARVFLVNPVIKFFLFPIGQDYHLPHHMYASVPHYRLKKLHETLALYEDYHQKAPVIRNLTETLKAGQFSKKPEQIYIDDSVLDDDEVEPLTVVGGNDLANSYT